MTFLVFEEKESFVNIFPSKFSVSLTKRFENRLIDTETARIDNAINFWKVFKKSWKRLKQLLRTTCKHGRVKTTKKCLRKRFTILRTRDNRRNPKYLGKTLITNPIPQRYPVFVQLTLVHIVRRLVANT